MARAEERFLASVSLFDGLPAKEIRRLGDAAFEKRVSKGERIFQEGLPADTAWIVKEGRVHLEKLHSDGKISTVCVRVDGDLLCCLPALDHRHYPATAIAKVPTQIVGVPVKVFSELATHCPQMYQAITAVLCHCLRRVEEMAMSCAFKPAEKRVVRALLKMEKKFGPEILLSRGELAGFCGLTRETTVRMISRLRKKKLLPNDRKRTLRIDAEKLRAHLASL